MRKFVYGLLTLAFFIISIGTAHGGTQGTLNWSYPTGALVESSPAIGADGTIYVGSDNGYLYAIKSDGSLKWSYHMGNTIFSSPAIGADGTVYVGSDNGKLYAITDSGTVGTLKWFYATGNMIESSPAIGTDGTIYVVSEDGKLYAITSSGTVKWFYGVGTTDSSPAIGADGTIYVGSWDSKLYAITDSGTLGTLKWAYLTGGAINSSAAIGADGTIYVASEDGKLYAITDSGVLKWFYALGATDSSPAIGDDGTIYVGSGDHNLYAITDSGTRRPVVTSLYVSEEMPCLQGRGNCRVSAHSSGPMQRETRSGLIQPSDLTGASMWDLTIVSMPSTARPRVSRTPAGPCSIMTLIIRGVQFSPLFPL